ncbi:hypothetical protein ACFYY8_06420 [Streptosporangium sp. NPDC001559]|uniref:hypothetical protein n=1 Tax=Streptosporangium sp. NPDC001559 TaxID=3366187 RepID=UPI0036E2DEC5
MTAALPLMLAVAAALLGVAAARRGRWLHATCCGVAALLAVYVGLLVGLPVELIPLAAAAIPFPLDDPDDHQWVRPAPADCPDCDCCTAQLCEQGRVNSFGCVMVAQPADKERVHGCPCSAETTPGTTAYAAAQVRAAKRAQQEGR